MAAARQEINAEISLQQMVSQIFETPDAKINCTMLEILLRTILKLTNLSSCAINYKEVEAETAKNKSHRNMVTDDKMNLDDPMMSCPTAASDIAQIEATVRKLESQLDTAEKKARDDIVKIHEKLKITDAQIKNLRVIFDDVNPVRLAGGGDSEKESCINSEATESDCEENFGYVKNSDPCPIGICTIEEPSGEMNCCQLKNQVQDLKQEFFNFKSKIECANEKDAKKIGPRCPTNFKTVALPNDYVLIEKSDKNNVSPCNQQIANIESSLNCTMLHLNEKLEKYANCTSNTLAKISEIVFGEQNNEQMVKSIRKIKCELESIKSAVCRLEFEKDALIEQNKIFEDQISNLGCIKADKEYVEEALAEKADKWELEKKVDIHIFNTAFDEITNALEELTVKLNHLEINWQKSVEVTKESMKEKLDSDAFEEYKVYLECELKSVKELLAKLQETKKESESAGARKVLRNMRCISCNKDAFMNAEVKNKVANPVDCKKSMRPEQVFKLDSVRKQKKILDNIRTMKYTSEGMDQESETVKPCNRYCGGSHTAITTQQKINATRNFASQKGLHDFQLISGFVEGADGNVYRGKWFIDTKLSEENVAV